MLIIFIPGLTNVYYADPGCSILFVHQSYSKPSHSQTYDPRKISFLLKMDWWSWSWTDQFNAWIRWAKSTDWDVQFYQDLIKIEVQKMILMTVAANFIPRDQKCPTLQFLTRYNTLVLWNKHRNQTSMAFTKHYYWFSSFQIQVSKEKGALEKWSATRDTEQLETAKSQPNQQAQLLAL